MEPIQNQPAGVPPTVNNQTGPEPDPSAQLPGSVVSPQPAGARPVAIPEVQTDQTQEAVSPAAAPALESSQAPFDSAVNQPADSAEPSGMPAADSLPPVPQPAPYEPHVTPVAAMPDAAAAAPRSGKKKLLAAGIVGVVMLLLAGGAVFGWYLPNTPGNVWNTSLDRTGKAIDSLVQSATAQDKLKAYATSAISGSVSARLDGGSYSGTFNTTFDKTSSDGDLNISLKDASGSNAKLGVKALSRIPSGSAYPDIYFQLNGLKDLGLDALVPGVSGYDGKWIEVSSSYLKSLGASYLSGTDNTTQQITAGDIAETARAAMSVTQQYVFSTAGDKAVLVKKSYVGKEKTDGISAYHYKAGVNVDHWRAYCAALSDAVISTNAYKKLTGDTPAQINAEKQSAAKDCKANDAIKASDTFDVWMDGHYKLIHKIRVDDKSNPGSYIEVGQNYKGGNELSLFVSSHDAAAKIDGTMTADINLDTNSTKATLSVKGIDASEPYTVTATLNADVSGKPVKATPPANPVQIQDVLSAFGLGDGTASAGGLLGGDQAKAKDSARQAGINSIDSHLEVVFATSGAYPTLAQLNDPSWRAANMPGLDSEALQDPDGTKQQLVAGAATATQYGYLPGSCSAAGCKSFALSALLSDGSTYAKRSL